MARTKKNETSQSNLQTVGTGALKLQPQPRHGSFSKTIGGTTYRVSMFYSQTSRENMNDKIILLIKNEASNLQP